jgi:hypothetical protein
MTSQPDETVHPATSTGNDAVVARAYGLSVPDQFGGTYVSGNLLLVFFTDDLAVHGRELASRVSDYGRVEVRPCRLSWRALSASMLRTKAAVVGHPELGVREIGFALRRGVLVTRVQLRRVTPEIVRKLREVIEPEEIDIDPIGHNALLR